MTSMRTARKPSQASTALTKKDLGYHLLKTLPCSYMATVKTNGTRRRSPGTDDDPISSSDEDSRPPTSYSALSNNVPSASKDWRQPASFQSIEHPAQTVGGASDESTVFRDPSSKMNKVSAVQRRSTRVQDANTSPKRDRDAMEAAKGDIDLDDFGRLSQGQPKAKKLKTYAPPMNIHGNGLAKPSRYSSKKSDSKIKGNNGFRAPNLAAMEEKCKTYVHWPRAGVPLTLISNEPRATITERRIQGSSGRSC